MALTRARLLVAVALIVIVPAALWIIWQAQRELPACPVPASAERAYEDDAVLAHAAAALLLLGAGVWSGALQVRRLVLAVAYGALCLAVPVAWVPVAAAGFLLAAQGAGLVLVGLAALLLAYAVGHPRALNAPARRLDHARMLVVLLVLATIGVQGELALVLTAVRRACGA